MISELHIPCPVCATKIPFDPVSLVKGNRFTCPGCSAIVGIAQEALDTANSAFEKYDALKKNAYTKKSKTQRQIQ